jgi:acyl-CoA reductase-like NAD-dependent aldehyde dehydrogenase
MNSQTGTARVVAGHDFSPLLPQPADSSYRKLDEMLERLRDGARRFAALNIEERIHLAQVMQQGYVSVAERSVAAGCRAKGIAAGTTLEAEEWATGPLGVIRQLRLVQESLRSIRETGNTRLGKVQHSRDGRLTVPVFPASAIDGLLFKDVRVDVRMQSGVSEDDLAEHRARFYRQPGNDGRVVMVLGAGNIAAIPAMDVITKMFNEGKVCLLKMNPVNAYQGPFIEEAFTEAIERGFLAVAYGGIDVGEYLTRHPAVDEIHITGSDKTYNAIVWGPPGPEQAERMARGNRVLDKPITAELGNVSPVIIVPGPFTDRELAFQAEDLAGAFTCNAAFLCCAPVVVITQRNWPQRETFFRHLERILSTLPPRRAYYPGAADRWRNLTDGKSGVKTCGTGGRGETTWALLRNLSAVDTSEPLFRNEPFCAVLAEVVVDAADPATFLEQAVAFANQRLWGTLSASLIVHPKTTRDPAMNEQVERAIADLRYGLVNVNTSFSGLSFVFGTPPWGGYPGASATDIQSGTGWVHNTLMLESVEKAVARFPLTAFPKPVYFPSHRTAHILARRLVALENTGSWWKVPGVVLAAARG